jgi:hypothetical protein
VEKELTGQRYLKRDGFVTRSITGETIIVPIRSGVGDLDCIFTLNESGSHLWSLIDEGEGVRRMVEALESEYEVSLEEAERDVEEFLDSLVEAGLIRPAGGE